MLSLWYEQLTCGKIAYTAGPYPWLGCSPSRVLLNACTARRFQAFIHLGTANSMLQNQQTSQHKQWPKPVPQDKSQDTHCNKFCAPALPLLTASIALLLGCKETGTATIAPGFQSLCATSQVCSSLPFIVQCPALNAPMTVQAVCASFYATLFGE